MVRCWQADMGFFTRLDGIPEPPAGYIPPEGSSRNTWANIYKNKGRIDYCVQQFGYLSNRIKCIDKLTGGPFLE